jgi:hypothetical protein
MGLDEIKPTLVEQAVPCRPQIPGKCGYYPDPAAKAPKGEIVDRCGNAWSVIGATAMRARKMRQRAKIASTLDRSSTIYQQDKINESNGASRAWRPR